MAVLTASTSVLPNNSNIFTDSQATIDGFKSNFNYNLLMIMADLQHYSLFMTFWHYDWFMLDFLKCKWHFVAYVILRNLIHCRHDIFVPQTEEQEEIYILTKISDVNIRGSFLLLAPLSTSNLKMMLLQLIRTWFRI